MIHSIIMVGGHDNSFWPISRHKKSKSFVKILNNESLLELTIKRASLISTYDNIWVVVKESDKSHVEELKKRELFKNIKVIYEPYSKNSASLIGRVAFEISKIDNNGIMVIMPSDHLIESKEDFSITITDAINYIEGSNKYSFLTIGIKPEKEQHLDIIEIEQDRNRFHKIVKFQNNLSKKQIKTIIKYNFQSVKYFFNTKIYLCKVSTFKNIFKENFPNIYSLLENINKESDSNIIKKQYKRLPKLSIESVFEKINLNIYMIRANFNLSHIESISSISSFWKQIDSNFLMCDKNHLDKCSGNIIYESNNNKTIFMKNIKDLVVIDSDDLLMIVHKNELEEIQNIYTDSL